MKAAFKLENTDEVEATLAMTMTLGKWKKVLGQVESVAGYTPWPLSEFAQKIREMIREAEQQFSTEHKDE